MDTTEDGARGGEKLLPLSKGKRKLHPGLAEPLGSKRFRENRGRGSERRAAWIKYNITSFGFNSHEGTRVEEFKRFAEELKEDEADHADIIASTILQGVQGFPTKVGTYAALVGWLNLVSFDLVELLLKKLALHLDLDVTYTHKKLLVRLLIELSKVSVVSTSAVIDFMEKLCNKNTVGLVLENIPWLCIPLQNSPPERLATFVESLKRAIAAVRAALPARKDVAYPIRPADESAVNSVLRLDFYENMCGELLDPSKVRIDLVSALHKTIHSPYDDLRGATDQAMTDKAEHSIGDIESLQTIEYSDGPRFADPMVQIFAPAKERFVAKIRSKSPDLPLSSIELAHQAVDAFNPIDRLVLTLQCDEILSRYAPRYKETARALAELKAPSALEHFLVEYLLGLLVALPSTRESKLYYEAIITQLCKDRPTKYGVVIEDVIDSFMACVRQADIEMISRFASWFSYHLFNFGLKWPWKKWNKLVETVEEDDPRKIFLNQLLGRTLSLSYRDDFLRAITPELAKLIPEVEQPVNIYEDEQADPVEKEMYQQTLAFVKTKPSGFKLVEWGKEHLGLGVLDPVKCRVLTVVMLQYGKPSHTHFRAAVKRVSPLFLDEPSSITEDCVEEMLQNVEKFWQRDPPRICTAFKELVNAKLVSFPSVLRRCLKMITFQTWWIFDYVNESLSIQDPANIEETAGILEVINDHMEAPYVDVLLRSHTQLFKT